MQRQKEMQQQKLQQQQQDFNPVFNRNSTASPSVVRMGQQSAPQASMLQNQIDKMQAKKDEVRSVPIRNQAEPPPTPSFDRRNSYSAAENIKSRLVNKTKTPTFGELQYRYGKDAKSPSPVLDKDYQKEARSTVVGELSRYQ